jgi:hypothetical protein
LPKPLAANIFGGKPPRQIKKSPDSDDLCDHYYRGFSFDDDALGGAPVNIRLGARAKLSLLGL